MFRKKTGLPSGWEAILVTGWAHWETLRPDEQARVAEGADWLLRRKFWEVAVGFDGFALTEAMRVLIAAQAALLVVGLGDEVYRDVESVIVWPTTIAIHRAEYTGDGFLMEEGAQPVLGEAHGLHGPVLLAWDTVVADAANPQRGRNVVYHEFAHKIDMWDGGVDGSPGFVNPDDEERWFAVCDPLIDALARGEDRPPLDPYGGTNDAEFFAVATETFFTRPTELYAHEPALYELLGALYNQDPRGREQLAR